MIVTYATFEVGAPDRASFDAWFQDLAAIARAEPGCLVYAYSVDPLTARGVLVEVWESGEAFEAHRVHPAHVEMLVAGSRDWDMRNAEVHHWMEAWGHDFAAHARADEFTDDSPELAELVRTRQSSSGLTQSDS